MNKIRFIGDAVAYRGDFNMALDDFLAREGGACGYAAIIRLYRWQRPTLSCGFHQKVARRVNLEGCLAHGVDVVKRPTGGRELLHENDISFSVTNFINFVGGNGIRVTRANFDEVSSLIGMILDRLGIQTRIARGQRRKKVTDLSPCSASPSQFELIWENKKIVPMAQRVYQDAILVHGSIPIVRHTIKTARLLKTRDPDSLQQAIDKSICSLEEILGEKPDTSRLVEAFLEAAGFFFKGEVNCLGLSKQELARVSKEAFNWSIKLNQD